MANDQQMGCHLCAVLTLAGHPDVVDLAVVWQLQRLLQLRLQRRLDRIVPLEIQATVGVDLKGFIHPAEVAIVVGIEQVLGVIKQFAFVQVEVDGPAVVVPLLCKRR